MKARRVPSSVTKSMVDQNNAIELHVAHLMEMIQLVEIVAGGLARDSDSENNDLAGGVEAWAALIRSDLSRLWEQVSNLGSELQQNCEPERVCSTQR